MIYLDNAATSFPKPVQVLEEMIDVYSRLGVSPGRGSYDLAVKAGDLVDEVRQEVCRFFGGSDPARVIFTANATDALNTVIQGLVAPGDHVVSTRLEHNSVLRPLHHLAEQRGITFDLLPFDRRGLIDPRDVAGAIRPHTRLCVLNHASNVLGTVQPAAEIGAICRQHGVKLVLDASQSAGLIPIDLKSWNVDAVAFTGHKSLLGPSGIGGLVLDGNLDIRATRFGGTGIDSRRLYHSAEYPYRLEAGTHNLLGIIGLGAALGYIARQDIEESYRHEMNLFQRLRSELAGMSRVILYDALFSEDRLPVLLCNLEGMVPEDLGAILDADFDIAVRTGLHCAPLVHDDLGTSPQGGVRFSLGPFNTAQQIDRTLEAMAVIARQK